MVTAQTSCLAAIANRQPDQTAYLSQIGRPTSILNRARSRTWAHQTKQATYRVYQSMAT